MFVVFKQFSKNKDKRHTVSHQQASHVRDASFQQPTVSSRLRENQVPQKEPTVPWIPTSPHSPPRPWSVHPALLSILVLHTGLYMLAPLCFPNIYVYIYTCVVLCQAGQSPDVCSHLKRALKRRSHRPDPVAAHRLALHHMTGNKPKMKHLGM